MHEIKAIKTLRRQFLTSAPFLLLGATSLKASALQSQAAPKGPDLGEALSPAELVLVNGSTMAVDFDNYWHKGYSCAETGLMIALRRMKRPEDLVWMAAGYGGGMQHGDLCGFLTAGVMAIGLHSGTLKVEAKESKARCGQNVNDFWNWWASTAPLHCRDIREGRKDFNVCARLGKLAAVKLETLLKS